MKNVSLYTIIITLFLASVIGVHLMTPDSGFYAGQKIKFLHYDAIVINGILGPNNEITIRVRAPELNGIDDEIEMSVHKSDCKKVE